MELGGPVDDDRVIRTTTLGSYPKPAYVPISDWFGIDYAASGTVDFTSRYRSELDAAGDDAEELFRRATAEVIADQVNAGIDVVTDGEVRRESYVHHQCRFLDGVDVDRLSRHELRGAMPTLLPTVTGPIRALPSPLAADFGTAQAMSARPVKVTLPGPMTIIDSTVDEHYRDERALGVDLAAALNEHIHDLVAAGCRHIQIDEPLMARRPDVALSYGIEQLSACFDGVPAGVTRVVHCCCGYPRGLDDVDYPKADPSAYLDLAHALDAAPVDQVSIEDAHRPNDLAALLTRFERTTVVLGVVAIARSRVEPPAEIAARLGVARRYLPDERLIAAPDCGLGFLPRELAVAKLRAITGAVALLDPPL